jgi:predicted transcriptional regulator
MTAPQARHPRHVHYGVRYQARFDAETSAKLSELAHTFRRKRAPILRHVMQWGLSHSKGWTIEQSLPGSAHLVHVLVEPAVMQQVQAAADRQQVNVATWLRHAMRQVTHEDFPASWRAGETAGRSHESGYYRRKFGLRLDDETSRKLERLTQTFHRSAAEVIRQLVAQANPEDFPQSWQLARGERREGDPS